jgi:hypothetical protein
MENMIHIMAQAKNNTNFAAYAKPAVNAALMELTQEQHTVEEWNRILLASSKGYFATASEYDEIKQRASRSSVFITAFSPKRVKFQDKYAARDGFGELEFTVNAEVRGNLQSDSSVNNEERERRSHQNLDPPCTNTSMYWRTN